MIHTHLHWQTDISKAPRGENVTTKYTVMIKGEPVERDRTDFVPTKILVLTTNGPEKVIIIPTYWIPPKHSATGTVVDIARWSGLNPGVEPLAWAAWPDADELMASIKVITSVALVADEEDAA